MLLLLLNEHLKENLPQAVVECILTTAEKGFPRRSELQTIICTSITQSLSGFFLSWFYIRNLGERIGHSNVCTFVVGEAVVLIQRQ